MTSQAKISLVSAALLASLGLASGSALAVQQGDILVRAGVANVSPTGESDELTSIAAGAKVEADDATSLGINFTYMATDNIGVELLAAWPFSHDINGMGSISGLGKVAETDQLPPTVTVQWHFMPSNNIRPFVGAGVNYTTFFNTQTTGALTGVGLDLDSSWGLAAEAGVDIDINSDWFVSGQVWYMDIDTDATIGNGIGTYSVSIDPWAYMIGIGTKF
ncbi:MAG: outer membrane beta-barrel protein [Gammaproteobacteria bacterium]|nr:outer membrane beta-barrel protein [Gammaproteobacteria bacterium]